MTSSAGLKPVALTFDDGPVEPYTTQVLEILRQQEVKATFFVIGRNVERHADTVRRCFREGHIIGNHTHSHNPWLVLLPFLFISDILLCQKTIGNVLGVMPGLFRPGSGVGFGIIKLMRSHKLTPVGWTLSAQDWRKTSAEDITRRLLKGAKPGAIVLLHDGHAPGKVRSAEATVQALAQLIKVLKEANYGFVTVPELLGIPPYQS